MWLCSVLWRVKQGLSYFMHGVRVWTKTEWEWDRWDMEIEFIELGFHTWKPSSLNSISVYINRVQWTRFPYMETKFIEMNSVSMYRNRVHWTRFIYTEIEFNELSFHTWKPSSMNSISIYGNRVHWTWFPCLIHVSSPLGFCSNTNTMDEIT